MNLLMRVLKVQSALIGWVSSNAPRCRMSHRYITKQLYFSVIGIQLTHTVCDFIGALKKCFIIYVWTLSLFVLIVSDMTSFCGFL